MAAPSSTVWGSIVGSYGRIGLYTSLSSSSTATSVTIEIWFWSKYTVSDTSNILYFDNLASTGSATTSKGSVTVSTTEASGSGWSTTNQVKLASYSASYTRGTSTTTRYLYASLANIDRVGGTMYVSTTISIPQLDSYTIAYNANGGSGAPSNQTKWYGTNITLSSTKPTRTGYTFAGWATSSSGSVAYAAGATYSANSSVTLYAKWTAITYTVSYNANGGSGAPSNQTKTYGTTLTLSSTKPTRTNYTFKGWGTSSSATTVAYAAGASYTANAGITLYAIWELSYAKPSVNITSLARCNSSGDTSVDGGYAKLEFSWATTYTATKHVITCNGATRNTTISGTSGSVSAVVGKGALSSDSSYVITVTVYDSGGSTTVQRTLSSEIYLIDLKFGGLGVAFGKAAETDNAVEFGWKALSSYSDCAFHQVHPNSGVNVAFGVGGGGTNRGIYDYTLGKWLVYGNGTDFYYGTKYGTTKPYYSAGDNPTIDIFTAGFVTGNSASVYFAVPLTKSIVGNPTITVTSFYGFQLRQNGTYTHGSSASVWATPSSYTILNTTESIIGINATFSSTANATNNAPIGVRAHIRITFS